MRIRLIVAAAVLASSAPLPTAGATPPEGDTTRTDLAKGTTGTPVAINTDGPATLMVQELAISPGASSGWHTHPGPEYSVITDGAVAVQTAAECSAATYGAGQAVLIPAGVAHRVANETGQLAEVIVTYTLRVNAPVRGDAPDPCAK